MKRQVMPAGVVALALAMGGAELRAEDMAGTAAPGTAGAAVTTVMKDALKDAAKGAVQGAAAAAGQGAAKIPAASDKPAVNPNDPASRAAALRRKALNDDDFVESDDNRDPFRSYLRLFVEKGVQPIRKVPAIFEKFSLEELVLIGIVSGDANPRAMFRDPSGLGQTVKRGDYVSKLGARVTKILSDRVILEMTEISGTGESRSLEKAILVNPEESQNK